MSQNESQDGYTLSEERKKQIEAVFRWIKNLKGAGAVRITNDPSVGAIIYVPEHRPGRPITQAGPAAGSNDQWFRIVSATQDSTNIRWTWTAKKSVKATPGYGGWADSVADTADYTLYNGIDNPNGATGTYGSGLVSTNLTGTFQHVPLAAGAIVHAIAVTVASDGSSEWWIDRVLMVDGGCE